MSLAEPSPKDGPQAAGAFRVEQVNGRVQANHRQQARQNCACDLVVVETVHG